MQSLGRWWAGNGLYGEEVSHGAHGSRQFEIGRVHNFFGERTAARYADRLRAMVRLAASGSTRSARLRAAKVFGAREFVARIVDHLIRLHFRRSIGQHAGDLFREHDYHEQHKRFHYPGGEKPAVRKYSVRSFARQTLTGAPESWPDGGKKTRARAKTTRRGAWGHRGDG